MRNVRHDEAADAEENRHPKKLRTHPGYRETCMVKHYPQRGECPKDL